MQLSTKVYDTLKWIGRYLLPALATLYFALAAIWDLPYGEQVVGTLSALTIFVGVLMGISTTAFNKTVEASSDGTLQIDKTNPEKDIFRLQVTTPFAELANKKTITLIVDPSCNLGSNLSEGGPTK